MSQIDTFKKFRFEVVIDGHMMRRCNFNGVIGDKFELTFKFKDVHGNTLELDGVAATLRFSAKGSTAERLELANGTGLTLTGSTVVALFDSADVDLALVYEFQLRLSKDGSGFVAAKGEADLTGLIE